MIWEPPEGVVTAVCWAYLYPEGGAPSSRNYKPVISLPLH